MASHNRWSGRMGAASKASARGLSTTAREATRTPARFSRFTSSQVTGAGVSASQPGPRQVPSGGRTESYRATTSLMPGRFGCSTTPTTRFGSPLLATWSVPPTVTPASSSAGVTAISCGVAGWRPRTSGLRPLPSGSRRSISSSSTRPKPPGRRAPVVYWWKGSSRPPVSAVISAVVQPGGRAPVCCWSPYLPAGSWVTRVLRRCA